MDLGLAVKPAVVTGGRADAKQAAGGFSIPEDVAALVVMVASDRAGNVTGAGFVIGAGLVGSR